MTLVLQAAAFALGVWLSIRTIAALYLLLDLRYAIRRYAPRVIANILGWGGAVALIGWLLPPAARPAFAWGLLAFLVFYLSLFVIRYPLLAALERSARRER